MGHPAEKITPAPQKEDIPICTISECEKVAEHITPQGVPYCAEHYKNLKSLEA